MKHLQIVQTENINNKELYSQAAWNLSYSAFWELLDFSIVEIDTAMKFIKEFIYKGDDPYDNYLIFCQRVIMAYSYIKRENGKYVPLPSNWFDKANDNGFAGTAKWMDALNNKRKALPLYRIELKAMAEAVLEMTEDPTVANFRYWKTYLLDRKQEGLYSLFISVVMNGLMTNKVLDHKN